MAHKSRVQRGRGERKMYQGGASSSPDNTLGSKDKQTGTGGMPKAEAVDQFQVQDKRLDQNRANQPNMPTRRTSVGDATNDVKRKK